MTLHDLKRLIRKAYIHTRDVQSFYSTDPHGTVYRFYEGKSESYLDVLEWIADFEEQDKNKKDA